MENEDAQVLSHSHELIVHEEYDPKTTHNDIALIKLPNPIEFTGG